MTAHLAETVEVYVDTKLVAHGRAAILPSYEQDFAIHKRVEMVGPATACVNAEGNAEVSVQLKTGNVSMDVVYTY